MIHISKDPFVPIRKNVTFIPFRICGAAGLVTGHAIATAIAKTSGWVKGPARIWRSPGSGNENTFLPFI